MKVFKLNFPIFGVFSAKFWHFLFFVADIYNTRLDYYNYVKIISIL